MANLVARAYAADQPQQYRPSPFADAYWKWLAIAAGVCFVVIVGAFLWYEFWSLAHGRPENTLSAQVWFRLNVTVRPIDQWSALQVLTLILWLTGWLFSNLIAAWLTGHFWFLRWR